MRAMKNILLATDFSNNAYSALFYATQLLKSKACTFYILNVFNELTPLEGKKSKLFGGKKLLDQLEIVSNEKLTSTFHKIMLDNANPQHEFKTLSRKGNLAKVIHKIIYDYNIDLVVMGSKGNTGAKEIFMGSNTVQVAKAMTKCPILAVPKQIDYKAPQEIAFITDFKKGCSKKSLEPLLFLNSIFGAFIRVMHITEEEILGEEQETNRKLMTQCLKEMNHSFHWVQDFTDKALAIDYFLEKYNIDLFAMIHHKHSFLERLVHEPVIKDVSIYADIPFLILPFQE